MGLAIAVAATRLLALSHSMWDWDEALFCSALRHYDVSQHHPHPPGFPLFIALGKAARAIVHDDFRALRSVNLLFACFAFPALYALSRALRFDIVTSVIAALFFCFMPNVWFYGGTALSDIGGVVAVIAGAAALLRGRDDERAWLAGSVLLGASLAFRPQNALIAVYPWCLAVWRRLRGCENIQSGPRWWQPPPALRVAGGTRPSASPRLLDDVSAPTRRRGSHLDASCTQRGPLWIFSQPLRMMRLTSLAAGAASTIAIVAIFYGGAILATGWVPYRNALRGHSEYLMKVDSYRSTVRPPISSLFYEFIVDPYHGGRIAQAIGVLALIGLVRARRPAFQTLAMFTPFALFMLLLLDPHSTSRYSMAYVPMLALLSAEGIRVLASAARKPRAVVALQCLAAAAILAALIRFTTPPLTEVRRHDSPPAESIRWIRRNLDPRATKLYIHGSIEPFARYLLTDRTWIDVGDDFSGLDVADTRNAWLLHEGVASAADAINFIRPHDRLWNIARHRYFEVFIEPLTAVPRFGNGWYDEEGEGPEMWRWMTASSMIDLPPLSGRAELMMAWEVPLNAEPRPPTVTITLNGKVVDRIVCVKDSVGRRWIVEGVTGRPNVLRISVDEFVNPARLHGGRGDARDLALRLNRLSWKPVP